MKPSWKPILAGLAVAGMFNSPALAGEIYLLIPELELEPVPVLKVSSSISGATGDLTGGLPQHGDVVVDKYLDHYSLHLDFAAMKQEPLPEQRSTCSPSATLPVIRSTARTFGMVPRS